MFFFFLSSVAHGRHPEVFSYPVCVCEVNYCWLRFWVWVWKISSNFSPLAACIMGNLGADTSRFTVKLPRCWVCYNWWGIAGRCSHLWGTCSGVQDVWAWQCEREGESQWFTTVFELSNTRRDNILMWREAALWRPENCLRKLRGTSPAIAPTGSLSHVANYQGRGSSHPAETSLRSRKRECNFGVLPISLGKLLKNLFGWRKHLTA